MSMSLPVMRTFPPSCASVIFFFSASGSRSVSTSSTMGPISILSVRGTDCSSLISSSVLTTLDSRSV